MENEQQVIVDQQNMDQLNMFDQQNVLGHENVLVQENFEVVNINFDSEGHNTMGGL